MKGKSRVSSLNVTPPLETSRTIIIFKQAILPNRSINKISKNVYFLNRLAETSALVSRVEKIDIYPEGIDTYLDFCGFKAILVFSPEILAICKAMGLVNTHQLLIWKALWRLFRTSLVWSHWRDTPVVISVGEGSSLDGSVLWRLFRRPGTPSIWCSAGSSFRHFFFVLDWVDKLNVIHRGCNFSAKFKRCHYKFTWF